MSGKGKNKKDIGGDDGSSGGVILVIGACALDRILAVESYPKADAKVRSTSYHEMGGGNAANTATACSLLASSSYLSSSNVGKLKVKLSTKIGSDTI